MNNITLEIPLYKLGKMERKENPFYRVFKILISESGHHRQLALQPWNFYSVYTKTPFYIYNQRKTSLIKLMIIAVS